MKVTHFMFAVYVLLLTVFPCRDNDTCVDELKVGITMVAAGNHDYSNAEQDLCTPFCICACCAAHVQLSPLSDTDFAGVIHNTKMETPYIETKIISDNNNIWQPPRS